MASEPSPETDTQPVDLAAGDVEHRIVQGDADPAAQAAWQRLEDQIAWYDGRSMWNQQLYRRLKLVELILAASLPVLAAFALPAAALGAVGAILVVLEGAQHLYKYHEHWITYRATCEALRHERYLYLAKAGPYSQAKRPGALLANRVEGLVSQEHAQWVTLQDSTRDESSTTAT